MSRLAVFSVKDSSPSGWNGDFFRIISVIGARLGECLFETVAFIAQIRCIYHIVNHSVSAQKRICGVNHRTRHALRNSVIVIINDRKSLKYTAFLIPFPEFLILFATRNRIFLLLLHFLLVFPPSQIKTLESIILVIPPVV